MNEALWIRRKKRSYRKDAGREFGLEVKYK